MAKYLESNPKTEFCNKFVLLELFMVIVKAMASGILTETSKIKSSGG